MSAVRCFGAALISRTSVTGSGRGCVTESPADTGTPLKSDRLKVQQVVWTEGGADETSPGIFVSGQVIPWDTITLTGLASLSVGGDTPVRCSVKVVFGLSGAEYIYRTEED